MKMEVKVSGTFNGEKYASVSYKTFPERTPSREKKAWPTMRCVVCYKSNRRKETEFWCPECETAQFVEESFKAFCKQLKF